jgi:hypothetical protein
MEFFVGHTEKKGSHEPQSDPSVFDSSSRVLKDPLEVRTETAKRAKSIEENDLK